MASRKTERGTPCSPRWDEYWIGVVERCEKKLDKRICGAELPGGMVCQRGPDSKNGRCLNHGGLEHIGGQKGNGNALREGLYSRRLRRCTDRCPHWRSCPMAAHKAPPGQSPACVYERDEYEATLSRVLTSLDVDPARCEEAASGRAGFEAAMVMEAAEGYALAKVLAQRAAAVLAMQSLEDRVSVRGEDRSGTETRVSGAAEACLRFQREQRNWHRRVVECGNALLSARKEPVAEGAAVGASSEAPASAPEGVKAPARVNGNGNGASRGNGRSNGRRKGRVRRAPVVPALGNGGVSGLFDGASSVLRDAGRLDRSGFLEQALALREGPAAGAGGQPWTVLDGPPRFAGASKVGSRE